MTKLGKHLFTFAVVADSHMTEADAAAKAAVDISFDTTKQELGNARSRHVVHAINRLAPDFVVHLGDITHPGPGSVEYDDSARQFHDVYAGLTCPLHLVPGNHDVGEKLFRLCHKLNCVTDYFQRSTPSGSSAGGNAPCRESLITTLSMFGG